MIRGGGAEALALRASDSSRLSLARCNNPAVPRRAVGVCVSLLLSVLVPLWAESQVAAGRPADSGRAALEAARAAWNRGEPKAALDILRRLRAESADSISVLESYRLSAEYTLARGDEYTARYFLQRLLDSAPGSPQAFMSCVLLARHSYDARSWSASLEYYLDAVDGYTEGVSAPRNDLDLALLRATELTMYHKEDSAGARSLFRRIDPHGLSGADLSLYKTMRVRLLWSAITPQALGLGDANVSCLRIDDDDLWIGTWNGGVARYAVSSARSDPFPGPAYSRSIEVSQRRVWIGMAGGLAWYGKSTGRWQTEPAFPTRNVQVVREIAGTLYAGTLGDGLFRLGGSGWEQVSDGDLPGRFITCMALDGGGSRLLIGTMNLGLVVLDLVTGSMQTLSEIIPDFASENITSVLADSAGRVWIGTYGDGLTLWVADKGTLRRFSRASGEIGDDWILASCETDRGVYFGSFGGGVSVFVKGSERWKRFGISDGLASADVVAIAWRAPFLFFGTLGGGVSMYDEAEDAEQL
jgi:hypothetical protein